ncbi:Hpr(Ser) kinase/phosphatase [Anaerorhabdus furcosa]|uniref:HPr kinase/phosphorylase n=2 Tax=Anaerorhabdus furcosa TaxID=118967 RepID=A0A1T4MRA3_9FIRM|nr:Hpr(Ser) kinase/phosphatase [Anaerorhabdus furcosa]
MEELEGKVMIRELVDYFKFEQVTGNEESLNRWVIVPDLNRPGLELAGFFKENETRRIVIIGDKELAYIETLDKATQYERFKIITDAYTPMIVFSRNREVPLALIEVADEMNFPIFKSDLPSYRLMVDLVSFLDERLAPSDSLHGVLISVFGKGVLITGESGMGKSEIALELIRRGHVLVADDRVDVSKVHNNLIGHSPELLQGMLEIRGIGIIDVAKMFGASSLLAKDNIDVVIKLEKYDDKMDYARVGIEEDKYTNILDINIPTIILPVKEGRSMAVLVESAVTNFQLKEGGFNSAKEFEERVLRYIEQQNNANKGAQSE